MLYKINNIYRRLLLTDAFYKQRKINRLLNYLKYRIINKISVDKINRKIYNTNVSRGNQRKDGSAMLTNFGKELRKLRIDHDELLKDMASNLGVTVAYLSAVENGKREVPDTWIDVLREKYQLSSDELAILQSLAYEGKNSLKIDLSKIQSEERELALAFARSFKSLSDEEMKEIRKILGR